MRPAILLALVLPLPLVAQTPGEKQATIQFLYRLQQPDGGFIPAPVKAGAEAKSSLRATSAAVRAINYLGGELPNKDKARAFVQACYDRETGAFADAPGGKGDVTSTAVGMMATAELQKDFRLDLSVTFLAQNARTFEERRLAVAGMEAAGKFDPVVKDWFAELVKVQNADGTHGTGDGRARESGGVAAMLLRAGERLPDFQRKAIVSALHGGQRPDGGFGVGGKTSSDGESTYRVMRALHLLKEKPSEVDKLREFVDRCRNRDGGYGVAPGQPSTVGGTYYAAVIGKWLAE